jgi:hypothetical protein
MLRNNAAGKFYCGYNGSLTYIYLKPANLDLGPTLVPGYQWLP